MSTQPPRPTAAALIMAHLTRQDTASLLDRMDCREIADQLACTLASMIREHGGDPESFAAMLAADQVRRAIVAAN